MALPLKQPFAPMEAKTADNLPSGDAWQYEPKWDGFRCLVFRDGNEVSLQSKSEKQLARYFPEVAERVLEVPARQFVLDGELILPVSGALDFDMLLQRIHPAASRIKKLAADFPCELAIFDLLVDATNERLTEKPLDQRRARLEDFFSKHCSACTGLHLSKYTRNLRTAQGWLARGSTALDGVMAKRLDAPYDSGGRDAMVKVKHYRSADCVVGGFRYASKKRAVGSLLLGLYDEEGLLHHVGFCSNFGKEDVKELTARLEALKGGAGFTGRAPGGPSRWATERSTQWESLRHELVVEIGYDHTSGERFRHGTRFMRLRLDKAPEQCKMEQITSGREVSLKKLTA